MEESHKTPEEKRLSDHLAAQARLSPGDLEPADPDSRWEGLSEIDRDEARRQQTRLTDLVNEGYKRFIEPRQGKPGHAAAWEAFARWRRDLQDHYSRRAFGKDAYEAPKFRHIVIEPFPEDWEILRREEARLRAEAEDLGAVPRNINFPRATDRAEDLRRVESPWSERYCEALRRCDWRYVFHVTRCEHLPSIGVLGLLGSHGAAVYSPDPIERETRQQADPEKDGIAQLSLCSSFWPPYWTFDKLGGQDAAVILALDAESICTRKGTSFFPIPTSHDRISIEQMRGNRNDTDEGFRAFLQCWDDSKPLSEGHGPRPDGPEIHSNYALPRDIKGMIFKGEDGRDRWFPLYMKEAKRAYGSVGTEAFVGTIRDDRRRFGFPS